MTEYNFVNAKDIEDWAERIDSRSDLPDLIRRLILATSNPSKIKFRAQEEIDYGGWDGYVDASTGTAFVPKGKSGWEVSTRQDIMVKANMDYDDRFEDPSSVNPQETTFVFCTPRRWPGKADWVKQKDEEREWNEVRVHDVDDIHAWLPDAPVVHVWFSRKIGKPVTYVQDLYSWWENRLDSA
ncbi:MAG: hypothetical protein R6U57_10645 [Anaerolineales bacterium]